MVASSDTAKKTTRRTRRLTSSHVAPRGERERVARPVERAAIPVPPRVSVRRSRAGRREVIARRLPDVPRGTVAEPGSMIARRADQLDLVLSARTLSAVILLTLGVVFYLLFQTDAFYVHHIEVGGLNYLTAEEIFTYSEVVNLHLFWVDPEIVRASVLRSPSVAEAKVTVGWPPHGVQIEIREREPAVIWEQAGVRTWIDVRGRVMQQRLDLEGMLRIVVEEGDGPLGPNVIIPQEVVDGALQLHTLLPALEALIYDPVEGLGYQDGRGWRAWFGVGTDMPARLNVYNAIVADLEARGIYPELIDVGDTNAPYYRVWWGREQPDPEAAATPAAPAGNQ